MAIAETRSDTGATYRVKPFVKKDFMTFNFKVFAGNNYVPS